MLQIPIKILYDADCAAGLVDEVANGIRIGTTPSRCGSTGGTYRFKNCEGVFVAVVKPTDEEPGAVNNKKNITVGVPGIKVGQSAYREVAAYLLDRDHQFSKVPMTVLIEIPDWALDTNPGSTPERPWNCVKKIASLQEYIPHFSSVEHYCKYESYLESCVHRIGILDIRTLNMGRRDDNILVRKLEGQTNELIPIDHGQCLPEAFHKTSFAWLHWPQASKPFTAYELTYIKNLKPFEDAEMLKKALTVIPESSLRVLVVCTTFLQQAASHEFCLFEIAGMMDRGTKPFSELEVVCQELIRKVKETNIDAESVDTALEPESSVGFGDLDQKAWSSFMESFPAALEDSSSFRMKNYRSFSLED